MQTGRLGEVLAGHRADGQDAADVFDDRRDRHRDHEQDRRHVEFGLAELGNRNPGRFGHLGEINDAEEERNDVTHRHADEDRHELEQALGADRRYHRGQQRNGGHRKCGAVRDHLLIASLAGRHVDRHLRKSETDHHHHRADDDRRQQAMDEIDAAPFDETGGDVIEEAGSG